MTETLLALVPQYGPPLLAAAVFLSCFALPVPASILLLAAGGFAAVGDLSMVSVALAAFAGLAAGDHTVYALGRKGGTRVFARVARHAAPLERAQVALANRGGPVIFLSRWLFSPLGPYVNFAAGAAGQRWRSFALWGTAGELVWLTIYLGLGYSFTGSLEDASNLVMNALLAIGAGVVTIALGVWIYRT
ncbi:hypothetical protein OG2516_04938 [Oceanicola granulosus HTCC2516]|uniref:VTT domain-containing protein n=1 Tax=Oceanicola granulosus (strain ATCC BAA-861 / DSM 15982 / KCTC 12143 / HTCC2516) TaxID=314256 RepID=Q2CC00_OCEGH|nr:VTT domain-containing protein [Oceanicola granulosus]EAR50194.1 hypothetical protein OG2516_04938 [Oceanicola granulosus HTCC2516]